MELSHAAEKLRRIAIAPPISSRKRKKMMRSRLRKVSWLSIKQSKLRRCTRFVNTTTYDRGCLVQIDSHEHTLSTSTVLNVLNMFIVS